MAYGGDGGDCARDVRLRISSEELAAAEVEAAAAGDGELAAACAELRLCVEPSLPFALDWCIQQASRTFIGSDDEDDQALIAAALQLRPWQASTVARAALLVRLRRSERVRLRIRGSSLKILLDRLMSDWDESRVPAGMAVGVFVATSISPPLTQGEGPQHVTGLCPMFMVGVSKG